MICAFLEIKISVLTSICFSCHMIICSGFMMCLGLYELWKTGRYKSYPPNTLVDLIARILALVPPWTRVYRVQRYINTILAESSTCDVTTMYSSRKYPYLPHGRFLIRSPTPLEIPIKLHTCL